MNESGFSDLRPGKSISLFDLDTPFLYPDIKTTLHYFIHIRFYGLEAFLVGQAGLGAFQDLTVFFREITQGLVMSHKSAVWPDLLAEDDEFFISGSLIHGSEPINFKLALATAARCWLRSLVGSLNGIDTLTVANGASALFPEYDVEPFFCFHDHLIAEYAA